MPNWAVVHLNEMEKGMMAGRIPITHEETLIETLARGWLGARDPMPGTYHVAAKLPGGHLAVINVCNAVVGQLLDCGVIWWTNNERKFFKLAPTRLMPEWASLICIRALLLS